MRFLIKDIPARLLATILVILLLSPCSVKQEIKQILDIPISSKTNLFESTFTQHCTAYENMGQTPVSKLKNNPFNKLPHPLSVYSYCPTAAGTIIFTVEETAIRTDNVPLYISHRTFLI